MDCVCTNYEFTVHQTKRNERNKTGKKNYGQKREREKKDSKNHQQQQRIHTQFTKRIDEKKLF